MWKLLCGTLVVCGAFVDNALCQSILAYENSTVYVAPNVLWSRFGSRIARGDSNGDGSADIFVADGGANLQGQATVLLGPSFAQSISISIPSVAGLASLGLNDAFDVADLNSDGNDDLLIGARGSSVAGTASVGRVFVSYGPLFTNTLELQLPFQPTAGAWFGASGAICDATGDGILDVVIGTPNVALSHANVVGRIDVYSGANGFVGPPSMTLVPPSPVVAMRWGEGILVADRDGNGSADLLTSHTVGGASGFAWLDAFNPTVQTTISPPLLSVYKPWHIMRFEDVTADGVRDLVTTDPEKSGGGQVFIARGPSYAAKTYLSVFGQNSAAYFGDGCDIGDVNRDGVVDLVVGAPDDKFTGTSHRGRVTIFYGPAFTFQQEFWGEYDWSRFGQGVVLHDVDADGFPEIYVACGEEWGGGSLHKLQHKTLSTVGASAVSLSAGGSVIFALHRGKLAAGKPYLLLMSASGSSPGLSMPYAGGSLHLALNFDAATNVGLAFVNGPAFQNFMGTLGSDGEAAPKLNIPAGSSNPLLVGLNLTFAAVIAESGAYIDSTSHAQDVTLGP